MLGISYYHGYFTLTPKLYRRNASDQSLQEVLEMENDLNEEGQDTHDIRKRCVCLFGMCFFCYNENPSPPPPPPPEPTYYVYNTYTTIWETSTRTVTWTATSGPYATPVSISATEINNTKKCTDQMFQVSAAFTRNNCSTEICIKGSFLYDPNYDGFIILNSNIDTPKFRLFDDNFWKYSPGGIEYSNTPWIPFPPPEFACFSLSGKRYPVATTIYEKFNGTFCKRDITLPLLKTSCAANDTGEFYETDSDFQSDPTASGSPCSNLKLDSNVTCSKSSCNTKLCFRVSSLGSMFNITHSNLLDPAEWTPDKNSSSSLVTFNIQKSRCWNKNPIDGAFYFSCSDSKMVTDSACVELPGKFYNPQPQFSYEKLSENKCQAKVRVDKQVKSCANMNGNILGQYPDCRNVKVTGVLSFDPKFCYSRFCYTVDPLGQSTNLDRFTISVKNTNGIMYPDSENTSWTQVSDGIMQKLFPWPLSSPYTSCFILPGNYTADANQVVLYSGTDDVCYKRVKGPGTMSQC
ncbi:hypothetical protein HMI54_001175 [Coelomomyces lativittatus]|nr:hypothetical protein HMI54_001175 [Coelomomyces lativittatus]